MTNIHDTRGASALAKLYKKWPASDHEMIVVTINGEALQVFKGDFEDAVLVEIHSTDYEKSARQ